MTKRKDSLKFLCVCIDRPIVHWRKKWLFIMNNICTGLLHSFIVHVSYFVCMTGHCDTTGAGEGGWRNRLWKSPMAKSMSSSIAIRFKILWNPSHSVSSFLLISFLCVLYGSAHLGTSHAAPTSVDSFKRPWTGKFENGIDEIMYVCIY